MRRIYHPWTAWECYRAGFYNTAAPPPMTPDEARAEYAVFLRDSTRFEAALTRVLAEWPCSCEQFLSNDSLNRIAWLGQASMCIATGVPACYRGGFKLLSDSEQRSANAIAAAGFRVWRAGRRRGPDHSVHASVGQAGLFGWAP